MDRRQGQADLVLRDGMFFLYVTLDVPEGTPGDPAPGAYLGVDPGIVNLAVDSDGTVYSRAAVDARRRVFAHRRRDLQRKRPHSARRKLQRLKRGQARA
jgi:transposase